MKYNEKLKFLETQNYSKKSQNTIKHISKNLGRYVDHTIYSFSPESKEFIEKYDVDVESIARHIAYDIYTSDDCQVVYAVHNHIENSKEHLHIHFAINTINFSTSKKRRENKQLTNARQKEFRNYVDDIFEDYK